jgi:undecaprenyl-diphosphatase
LGVSLTLVLQAALLGVIQGLTEFLPISSTAHLLVAQRFLGFEDPGGVFTVLIQLGSILAVMWLYRERLMELIKGLPGRPEARRFAAAILAAFVPAVVAGLFLSDFVKRVLYSSFQAIAVAFIVGGIIILIVERRRPAVVVSDAWQTPVGRAFGIGVSQTLALVPGVSRSGATIVGGMLLGLSQRAAAEFSFFVAMPTMIGAFVHDAWEVRHYLSPERTTEIGVGFVMAFLAALVVVRPFVNFISRSGFAPFAWYRIAAGIALLGFVAAGWL